MITRSANPALNKKTFTKVRDFAPSGNFMTLQGTVNKTGVLLILALLSASWVWRQLFICETTLKYRCT